MLMEEKHRMMLQRGLDHVAEKHRVMLEEKHTHSHTLRQMADLKMDMEKRMAKMEELVGSIDNGEDLMPPSSQGLGTAM